MEAHQSLKAMRGCARLRDALNAQADERDGAAGAVQWSAVVKVSQLAGAELTGSVPPVARHAGWWQPCCFGWLL